MIKRVARGSAVRADDIEIVFPFGGKLRASGRMVICVLLVVSALGFLFWHDYRTNRDHLQLVRSITVMTYVLTLSDGERRALQLEVPDELIKRTIKKGLASDPGEGKP